MLHFKYFHGLSYNSMLSTFVVLFGEKGWSSKGNLYQLHIGDHAPVSKECRMWREIILLAAYKPVIASLFDVAVSGGYYNEWEPRLLQQKVLS